MTAIHPQHLIGKLRHTQAAMRETARMMRDAGIDRHAGEMDGAADIIDSWIKSIALVCRKCGGDMKPGKAIGQTYGTGLPDFPGDADGMTVSPAGPGKLVDCLKCKACGWSVTAGVPETKENLK